MEHYEISLTIGPEEELRTIIKSNPDRQFKIFQSVEDETEFMLLDYSGKRTIFHSGLDYYTCDAVNPTHTETGYLECRYVTLNKDDQKVFKSIFNSWHDEAKRPAGLKSSVFVHAYKDDFEFLLIDLWESEDAFMGWNVNSNEMNQFGHDGNKTSVIKVYKEIK